MSLNCCQCGKIVLLCFCFPDDRDYSVNTSHGVVLMDVHLSQEARLGFRVSLLGKSGRFVTADVDLEQKVRALPDCYRHLNSGRHILIRGGRGVGKKTLVHHSWKLLARSVRRPLVGEKCQFISKESQLWRFLQEARGGDLFLENVDVLPAELWEYVMHNTATDASAVRIIATSASKELNPAGFLVIDVPALQKRPYDQTVLCDYLVRHRLGRGYTKNFMQRLKAGYRFFSTKDLYIFLVNICFVAACLGKERVDEGVLEEVGQYSGEELMRNYFIFFANNSGFYEMIDEHGLRDVCHLSEQAYIASSMIETRGNQFLASKVLSIPTTTLSNKKKMLPSVFRKDR